MALLEISNFLMDKESLLTTKQRILSPSKRLLEKEIELNFLFYRRAWTITLNPSDLILFLSRFNSSHFVFEFLSIFEIIKLPRKPILLQLRFKDKRLGRKSLGIDFKPFPAKFKFNREIGNFYICTGSSSEI